MGRGYMSGARLDLAWSTEEEATHFVVELTTATAPGVMRQIGARQLTGHCPQCKSIVYSRRHRMCGVCNQPLPDALLFSEREAERVAQLVHKERSEHRRWLEQREAVA
jgi:hypothetical protein